MRHDIGDERKELKSIHQQEVYDAVFNLGKKVRRNDIWMYLDQQTKEWNHNIRIKARSIYESQVYNWTKGDMENEIRNEQKRTINPRTISRCLKAEPRITKEGSYYYISDEVRFERKYQRPSRFGMDMFTELLYTDFKPGSLEHETNEFIRRWGALIMFNFIEAVRPFEDKSMTLRDRSRLVRYWARNSLPIDQMFSHFQILSSTERDHATGEWDEQSIKQLLDAFKKTYPDLYKILTKARRGQTQFGPDKGPNGVYIVHGKTHHTEREKWLSYLNDL